MPFLAAFLGPILGAIFAFLIRYLTKKVAVFLTVLLAVTVLTTTFWAALYALISGVSVALPPEALVFSGFLPDNIPTCISIIMSARTLAFVYAWNVKIWSWKLTL